ncbi:alpha/beta fold hydrolase [Magnetovibrio sp.]|uniref:alpha/beta fold hydrolase n=1 Tax=Magnetovibrio sp. TaxID=2024836 RepID=UPI002F94F495
MSTRETLILIPGLLCDAALWAHQVIGLSDLVDVHVADIADDNTMETMAAAILDYAPDNFALAGLSMGGYVAQEIMRQEPGRVTHLGLLDTNARADLPEQSETRKALMAEADAGHFDAIAPKLLPKLVNAAHAQDPAIAKVVLQMAERVGVDGFINQQNAILNRVDGRPDLAKIDCPTLVLCGADDAMTPPSVHQEMVDGIGANATLTVIPDCGHLSPLEQPDAVTAAMRAWLGRS